MQILGVCLAAYVVVVWIGWVRRGPEPTIAILALSASIITLWSAWDIWHAVDLPFRQIALFFGGCLTAGLTSMVLRRRGRAVADLLLLWILLVIPRELQVLFRDGAVTALPTLKLHFSIGIILGLRIAAAANLFYVMRRRKDLLGPPTPRAGDVFD